MTLLLQYLKLPLPILAVWADQIQRLATAEFCPLKIHNYSVRDDSLGQYGRANISRGVAGKAALVLSNGSLPAVYEQPCGPQ